MSESAVVTYGRFQPPTIAHDSLIDCMCKLGADKNAEVILFASPTHGELKNPLPTEFKLRLLEEAYDTQVDVSQVTPKGYGEVIDLLRGKFKKVIFVLGSDRNDELAKKIKRYHLDDGFEELSVYSAGERDDTPMGKVSASELRDLVINGHYEKAEQILSTHLRHRSEEIFEAILASY